MAGGVVDGQNVAAAVVNPAFINKNGDDVTPSNIGLASTNPLYGSSITSTQRELNAHASAIGISINQVYNFLITWANNIVGVANDTIVARIQAIVLKFKGTTAGGGHAHAGTDGDGAKIPAFNLDSSGGSSGQVPTADGLGNWIWGSGGGGGGGSLQWIEAASAPPSDTLSNLRVYYYGSALLQSLQTVIRIPTSYIAGKQINLKLDFFSPDSSGTALMQAAVTLIRPGTDVYTTSSNTYTSTNAVVTLGAGTVNIPQNVTMDLCDNTGKIAGIALTAGMILKVSLKRGSDTATSDLSVLVYDAEVTFS